MKRRIITALLLLALLFPAALAEDGWGSLEQYETPFDYGANEFVPVYEGDCSALGGVKADWREPEPLEGDFLVTTASAEQMTDTALLTDEEGRLYAVKTYLSLSLEDPEAAGDGLTRLYNTAGTMALACGGFAGEGEAMEAVRTVAEALKRVLDFSGESYEEFIRGRTLTVEIPGAQATVFAKLYFVEGQYMDVIVAVAPEPLKF